jgi:hypothetical protein
MILKMNGGLLPQHQTWCEPDVGPGEVGWMLTRHAAGWVSVFEVGAPQWGCMLYTGLDAGSPQYLN